MRNGILGLAVTLVLGVSGAAEAGGAVTGRVGASAGSYNQEATLTDQGCCGNPIGTEVTSDYDSGQFSVLGGIGVSVSRFFADVGLEAVGYTKDADTDGDGVEDTAFFRSDFLLTGGVFIGDHWSAFAGYRHSTQGDGLFSEDLGYTTNGPFIGGGFSFTAGKRLALGASAAYNVLSYSEQGTVNEDVDYGGVSLKLQCSFLGTPHAVFLRWQRFTGEENQAGLYDIEITDDYVNVGYQATFDLKTW